MTQIIRLKHSVQSVAQYQNATNSLSGVISLEIGGSNGCKSSLPLCLHTLTGDESQSVESKLLHGHTHQSSTQTSWDARIPICGRQHLHAQKFQSRRAQFRMQRGILLSITEQLLIKTLKTSFGLCAARWGMLFSSLFSRTTS